VTLDVSCLLHLPIDGMLLGHEELTRDEAVEIMIRYLGSNPGYAIEEVINTRGSHARFVYLRRIVKERLLEKLELIMRVIWRRRSRICRSRLSTCICYTWRGSRSSLTRAPTMWMLPIWSTLETWKLLLIIHGELLHYHTCIGRLTMLPITTPSIYQDTWLCSKYK